MTGQTHVTSMTYKPVIPSAPIPRLTRQTFDIAVLLTMDRYTCSIRLDTGFADPELSTKKVAGSADDLGARNSSAQPWLSCGTR